MILWLTSFNEELYEASGQFLLKSKIDTETDGDWFIGYEGFGLEYDGIDLNKSQFLKAWLHRNKNVIPEYLGGKAKPCKCSNPMARAAKDHKRGCHYTWFNRNMSRWFRKVATLYHAIEYNNNLGDKYDKIIWIDSDCLFTQKVAEKFIDDVLFEDDVYDVFYLKGTERKVMEAGLVGYNLKKNALDFIWKLIRYYSGNDFTRLIRWDDSYVIQKLLFNPPYKRHDIATIVSDGYSGVFEHSLIGSHIIHNKGRHGRKLGIMK